MTLGLITPDGVRHRRSTSASPMPTRARRSRRDTLFQIGSISKVMTAALLHQFAAEGRFQPDRPDQRPVAGDSRCRRATRSRSSICSTMSPAFPATRRCFPTAACGPPMRRARTGIIRTPATRSSASSPSISAASRSTGCSQERILAPLGMRRSRAARSSRADRTLYAQGYEAADQSIAVSRAACRWRPRRGST